MLANKTKNNQNAILSLLKEIGEFLADNKGASLKTVAMKSCEVKAKSPTLPFVGVQPYRFRPNGIHIDHGSTYLLPSNYKDKFVCGISTGDGSCLYNSVCILFIGNENLALLLRLLTVLELLEHAEYYLDQPIFCTDYAWSDAAMLNYDLEDPEIEQYPKKPYFISEVHLMTYPTAWSPLLALYGISSVVCCPLQSLYFQTILEGIAERFTCLIYPRQLMCDSALVILWTSSSVRTKSDAKKFVKDRNAQPNHFVPCFLRGFEENYSGSEQSDKNESVTKKQTVMIVLSSDDEMFQVCFNFFSKKNNLHCSQIFLILH
jgi:hypothetical protein